MLHFDRKNLFIAAGFAGILYFLFTTLRRRSSKKEKYYDYQKSEENDLNMSKEMSKPDANDYFAVKSYFLEELKCVERDFAVESYESGIEHLVNAVLVCNQPATLLEIYAASVPAPIYERVILELDEIGFDVDGELN